jgi:hypothetical protein
MYNKYAYKTSYASKISNKILALYFHYMILCNFFKIELLTKYKKDAYFEK